MRYLARKLGFYAIALWAAITLNFLIPRLSRGNPVDVIMSRTVGSAPLLPEYRHALELQYGVSDDPIYVQYWAYLRSLAHGDLGLSIGHYPTPVTTIIFQAMPWTIIMVGLALLMTVALGLGLGTVAGWKRGSRLDALIPSATFLAAIPYFWLAQVLLLFFGSILAWFPLNSGYNYATTSLGWTWGFVGDAIYHGVLPAATIVISSIAGWMLGMRNMMVSTMAEDYVAMAEAKGLSPRRIMVSYAARNAVLPSVAGFAISIGFVVSGAIATEVVFSYPGIGYELIQAVQNVDYPLMQALFLIITLSVLGANLLVDVVYGLIDPRTRQAA